MLVLRRLVASLVVAGSLAGTAPSAFAQSEIDSYFEFLMARRLEGAGDFAGARAALAIDENNIEAHRALGLVFAGYADGGGARGASPEVAAYLKDAIIHLERAAAAAAPGDLVLHFTLGRLYLRTDQPQKAVDSLNRVVSLNPGSVQARL